MQEYNPQHLPIANTWERFGCNPQHVPIANIIVSYASFYWLLPLQQGVIRSESGPFCAPGVIYTKKQWWSWGQASIVPTLNSDARAYIGVAN